MKYLLLYLLVSQPVPLNPQPMIVSIEAPGYVLTDPAALFHAYPHTCKAWAQETIKDLRATRVIPQGATVQQRFHCENGV